mgnify:CR=1 FL=1
MCGIYGITEHNPKFINHLNDIFKKDRTIQHILSKTIHRDLHYLNRIQNEYSDCFFKITK